MDQVSRPFQIALVAVVLLAGMWFTVLRPKSDSASTAPAAASAPGTAGLTRAVDKAHGAAAASDAANAAAQAGTGEAASPSANATAKPASAATHTAKPAAKAPATKAVGAAKPATTAAKPGTAPSAKPATDPSAKPATDPSAKLLASLAKGKTVVFLFHGTGADDRAARRAVRRATRGDRHVTVASAPISKVGTYQALTSDVEVLTAPTILVIGRDHRAVTLTGYVDQRNITQAIGDARRAAAKQ